MEETKEKPKRNHKERLLEATTYVSSEYRKNLVTALSAALAFVIALYIRDSVTSWVDFFLKTFNLTGGEGLLYKTVLGFIVVGVCVVGIIILSKFSEKEETK